MKPTATSAMTSAAFAALLLVAGCGESNDGPAEQAGEQVDEAAEEAEEQAEEAGDEIEQATD